MIRSNQRGDTLIEVILALTIMATVLTSAFYLANRSILVGRVAKERSLMVGSAQQQAEALTSYRDRNGWSTFVTNIRTAQAAGSGCFWIVPDTLVMTAGGTTISTVPTSNMCITSDITAFAAPDPATFTITYKAQAAGGGPDLTSSITLKLTNTDGLKTQVYN